MKKKRIISSSSTKFNTTKTDLEEQALEGTTKEQQSAATAVIGRRVSIPGHDQYSDDR